MMWPALNKISFESIKALVLVPMWLTQSWFNKLSELAVEQPIIIERNICNFQVQVKNIVFFSRLKSHSRSAPTSTIQKERINALNTVWRDGTKKNIDTYSETGKNFAAKGTTTQCRLMQI